MSVRATIERATSTAIALSAFLFFLTLSQSMSAQDRANATVELTVKFDTRILQTLDVELVCARESRSSSVFSMGPEETRIVAFDSFTGKGAICQVRAFLPPGYSIRYAVAGDNARGADRNGCHFTDIDPGESSSCQIEVVQEPVRLTVYKKWIGPSGEEPSVRMSLECESGDYSGDRFINEGKPDSWEIVNIGPEGVLCNVSEEVRETYRPDIIDCQGLWILPGKGEECTMVNTKIVKRIEVLTRYGKILMIVLFLIVGLIAVKRLA